MNKTKIFVYGTLMKDFHNYNKYLKDKVTSIETGYIYGKLYHLYEHDCPAVIDGNDKVYGEIIEFFDDIFQNTLNKLDNFEKYFFGMDYVIYEREYVDVYYSNSTSEKLSFYKLINLDILEREHTKYIDSGNWKAFFNNNY
ncbi:AIG2-like family protein [Clostridium puniceum]|uniref:AIG2-like family protein n=1 Tax=Clostridium puniceum TaxID=29367 RepID=A0A1S8TPT5_9CLOT|nr:gamma-glutamylcyclotransferase family protein [Clostridium puniceum]OOM79757.1 AIG2-like family protein [Clostridium puniceum]